jgi:hypothetical protein
MLGVHLFSTVSIAAESDEIDASILLLNWFRPWTNSRPQERSCMALPLPSLMSSIAAAAVPLYKALHVFYAAEEGCGVRRQDDDASGGGARVWNLTRKAAAGAVLALGTQLCVLFWYSFTSICFCDSSDNLFSSSHPNAFLQRAIHTFTSSAWARRMRTAVIRASSNSHAQPLHQLKCRRIQLRIFVAQLDGLQALVV